MRKPAFIFLWPLYSDIIFFIDHSLTKITHKFHVYATYKFLPAVVSFWHIRELTGFCMQMSFTYKNFM